MAVNKKEQSVLVLHVRVIMEHEATQRKRWCCGVSFTSQFKSGGCKRIASWCFCYVFSLTTSGARIHGRKLCLIKFKGVYLKLWPDCSHRGAPKVSRMVHPLGSMIVLFNIIAKCVLDIGISCIDSVYCNCRVWLDRGTRRDIIC